MGCSDKPIYHRGKRGIQYRRVEMDDGIIGQLRTGEEEEGEVGRRGGGRGGGRDAVSREKRRGQGRRSEWLECGEEGAGVGEKRWREYIGRRREEWV
jgi:hypothetical protein